MADHRVFRIHPGIGIARLGNSEANDDFLGPEVPSLTFVPPPSGNYRNSDGNIRRQGIRFRIYEYVYRNQELTELDSVREITSNEAEISWNVHLVNRKPFRDDGQRAPIDPGEVPISGTGRRVEVSGDVQGSDVSVHLGTLKTDPKGRLIVLGGFGKNGSFHADQPAPPIEGLRSPWWWDDTSDGPIRASVRLHSESDFYDAAHGWAIVGVPAFAYPIPALVTLYDLATSAAMSRESLENGRPAPIGKPIPWLSCAPDKLLGQPVSFKNHIYPVLYRTVSLQWSSSEARGAHGEGNPYDFLDPAWFATLHDPSAIGADNRQLIYEALRPRGNMPKLRGGLQLTDLMQERFRLWMEGQFVDDWPQGQNPHDPPEPPPFDHLPPERQVWALDKTSLWSGVGGSFAPGIEADSAIAHPDTYSSPYRISLARIEPGGLTSNLSVPWQVDFQACEEYWWPSARPGSTSYQGHFHPWVPDSWERFPFPTMLQSWWKLGFLAREGHRMVETERLAED